VPNLTERSWLDLWRSIGAQGDPIPPLRDLVCRHLELHRSYHALPHVDTVMNDVLQAPLGPRNLDALKVAIWYHDAVYDTKAKDSEEKSVALFRTVAETARLGQPFIETVAGLILATKHAEAPKAFEWDKRILCDADLAILGQPEEAFDHYEWQIRKEYRHVPVKKFRTARRWILQSLLRRQQIYTTGFFADKYERQARKNLERSVQSLWN